MKIEAGKQYVDREGRITPPLRKGPHAYPYPFEAVVEGEEISWTEDGTEYCNQESDYDLVEEYVGSEPKESKMKIEAGKRYVDRGGRITTPLHKDSSYSPYPFMAAVDGVRVTWTEDGTEYFHRETGYDLVEEYMPPEPKESKMKLEAGKQYVDREGRITTPLHKVAYDTPYPFEAVVEGEEISWTEDGTKFHNRETGYDLVEEYMPPQPGLVLEAGKKYVTREGKITSPLISTQGIMFPYIGTIDGFIYSWMEGGNLHTGGEDPRDLMYEYEGGDIPKMGELYTETVRVQDISFNFDNKEVENIVIALNGERGDDQQAIAEEGVRIVDLLLRKNSDYGGSAFQAPVFAPSLKPRTAMLCRMSDKIARINALQSRTEDPEVTDESLEDTFRDLCGYLMLYLSYKGD